MSQIKEATIYDIAEQLNISPATVSRGLNNHPAISKLTKKRIFQMADKLGYRANTFASSLRKQHTNTVGVLVQRLNSFFIANALSGIEKVANEAGYNVIISQSLESVKKEISNSEIMFKSRVDGLIVSLAWDTEDINHLQKFFHKGIPVAFFDRGFEYDQSTTVMIDNFQLSYELTQHMIEQGCRRIMHVGGTLKRSIYVERMRGWKQALEDAGIPHSEDLLLVNNLTDEGGLEAAQHILNMPQKPDGIFAASDICAASCMAVLKENGIKVPEDMAIAGFNNDPVTRMTDPKITTIANPGYKMGEIVAATLIDHLKGKANLSEMDKIILSSEIIIRGSTLKKGVNKIG